MATYKITWLFNAATGPGAGGPLTTSTRTAGWSETLYVDTTASLTGFINGYANARAALLPQSASINGARVTQVVPAAGKGASRVISYPGPVGQLTDLPNMALLCVSPGVGVTNVRRFTLRCIPDSQVTYGEFTPDAGYLAAVNNFFLNGLVGLKFAAQDLSLPLVDIINITSGGLVTCTALPPGITVGEKVSIYKTLATTSQELVSGKFLVQNYRPATLDIQLGGWDAGASTGGKLRRYGITYVFIDTANTAYSRAVSRKVGRPFVVFHGRRSKSRAS